MRVPFAVAQAEEGAPARISEDYEPTEGAPTGSPAVDPSIRSFGLRKRIQQYEAMENGKLVFRQTWPELYLDDGDGRSLLSAKNFPRLAAALEAYNYSTLQEAYRVQGPYRDAALQDYTQRKESGYADSFGHSSSECDLIVKRADSLVLSFVETSWTYTGGAHGMTSLHGVNFDAATGERLSLHQVFPDAEMLVDTLIGKLYAENNPAIFFDSMESTVADGVIHDKISWVIGPRGVTFYFNPYDIAPYASGIITTAIMFDERPGQFNEKYKHGPASYCEELIRYPADTVSLTDNGMGGTDKLLASVGDGTLTVTLNGKTYETPFMGTSPVTPVHVHTGDGRNYLYVDYGFASPKMGVGRQMNIYRLGADNVEFVRTTPYSFQRTVDLANTGEHWTDQWIMTDPFEFKIDDPYAIEDGKSKTHTVEIGTEGTPTFG